MSMAEPTQNGGQGVLDTRPSRSDLVLFRKAVNGGYNLTHEQRQKIVARAAEILESQPEIRYDDEGNIIGASYRDVLGAAKVLLSCDKMDMEAEKLAAGVTGGTVNNTQYNIDARGNADLVAELKRQLTVDELRVLRDKIGGNGEGHG